MKHETHIDYKGGLSKLAADIGDLRYDALAEFLSMLSDKLANDASKDRERRRAKLAARLGDASVHVGKASRFIESAWKICAPYEDTWVIASVMSDQSVNFYYSKDRVDGSFWVENALKATRYHREEVDKVLEYVQGMLLAFEKLSGKTYKVIKMSLE